MKIYVVGIGPGGADELTPRAEQALRSSDVIIGYQTYVDLVRKILPERTYLSSGMTGEVERCILALEKALSGLCVALISGGDSGIYGMAGIMLEVVNQSSHPIPVEVIPGITAASAAAALLGAPLMHDFAVISLSDRLTPWPKIARRIELAAAGDFVICFYNPKSRGRQIQLGVARELLLNFRAGATPVGIVRNAGRDGENYDLTNLDGLLQYESDMFTVILVGNSQTYIQNGKMITPRGYSLPEAEIGCQRQAQC